MRGPRVVGGRGHCPVLLMTDEETEIMWRGVKAKHLIPDSPLGVLFRCPHCLLYELHCGDGDTLKWKFLRE